MESHHLSSYYGAIAVVTTFCATVIFICCKLARQTNQIEERYSPCRIQPQPEVRLRKPKSGPYRTSVATQTVNVEQLYAALKKETVDLGSQQLGSSAPSCSTCVTENKGIKLEPELYANSSNFYQNPSLAYECVADIHRATAIYTSVATENL